MDLREFCQGIGLMPEAAEKVLHLNMPQEEYQMFREVFARDKKEFYDLVLGRENYRMQFLYLYCRMGLEAYEKYVEKDISREIFFDTFRDLTYWCENCFSEYGEYGINEYHWFFRHIELRIFRLGRLQFERLPSEWEFRYDQNRQVKKGDPVISIHIPQGERLDAGKCLDSCQRAFTFWGEQYPYICYSWLLDPALQKILPSGSNILKFQELFTVARTDFGDRYGEWRIFGKLRDHPEDYPEKTTLQRQVKQYLLTGKQIGEGLGILNVWKDRKNQTD